MGLRWIHCRNTLGKAIAFHSRLRKIIHTKRPMTNQTSSILYISYTGLLEPLGQSQVYPYLRGLADSNNIFLITFEKESDLENEERFMSLKEKANTNGIEWYPLKYHKEPTLIATSWDILVGIRTSFHLIRENDIDLVHARSYVPSIIALACQNRYGTKFVFDMRGFWADERVEGGIWNPKNPLYWISKWFERRFIRRSDVTVSLTDSGIEAMKEFCYVDEETRFEQIPTCTDLDQFRPYENDDENQPFILGYVGSVGTWYLFEDVLECFSLLQESKSNAQLHILNKDQHEFIYKTLDQHEIPKEQVTVESVLHENVPHKMAKMDAGVFFYRPTFSKRGTSPTKMGEFLACGVPCLSNKGVGDVESLLKENEVGVVLQDFSKEEKRRAIKELIDLASDPDIKSRCRNVAEKYYSLSSGVDAYDKIYQSLT